MFIIYDPLHSLEQHVGMITFQSRLGAGLYIANRIRGRWYAIDLMGRFLVEELGPSILMAIINGVVGSINININKTKERMFMIVEHTSRSNL